MPTSVEQAIEALQRTERRFTKVLRSRPDPSRPVSGIEWNVGELAAHLASGSTAYREIAEGGSSPYEALDRRAETNQQRLEAQRDDDLGALADQIDRETAGIVAAMRSRHAGDVVAWHGGEHLPVTAFLGAAVGEFTFHGCDLARTLGEKWPIERDDALPVIDFFAAVTPLIVDRTRARGLTATYDVRFRGYDALTFAFDDGSLSVVPGRAARADVHLSVDPVAFLRVGYKRAPLAGAVLTGRAIAWGRRPWLAFGFPRLFQNP